MRTRDAGLATVLKLLGHHWIDLYPIASGDRVEFIFPDTPAVFAVERDYRKEAVQVDARQFFRTYKDVMDEVKYVKGLRPSPSSKETVGHARADTPTPHA